MLLRLTNLLLALFLLGSGLAPQEHAIWRDLDGGRADVQLAEGSSRPDGTVEEHHLDEQPTQAPVEVTVDLSDVLLTILLVPEEGLAMHWPPYSAGAPTGPFLGGPQRPPRSADHIA